MIIVDCPIKSVIFAKETSEVYNYYAFIIQNETTKEVTVFNVTNESTCDKFYKFIIDMTDLPYGEYTYYLAPNDPSWQIYVDSENIYESVYCTDLGKQVYGMSLPLYGNSLPVYVGEEGTECNPLHIIQSCVLRYNNFESYSYHNCCNYNIYEGTKKCR